MQASRQLASDEEEGDMKNPWMKFYPSDWRGDAKLRMCSIAARGLWLEMLAIAHEAEEYGCVTINGKSPTNLQLAKMVGEDESWVTQWVTELENSGVFSRTSDGVIYSRRMVRDYKKAEVSRENGKNGGSSKHKKNKADLDLGNLKPTQQLTHNEKSGNQISESLVSKIEPDDLAPDTRYQIPDKDTVPNGTGDEGSPLVLDIGKRTWDFGYDLLAGYDIPKLTAGKLLGKWLKTAGSIDRLYEVLQEAAKERRGEIVPYVEACIAEKKGGAGRVLVDKLYAFQGGPMPRGTAEFQIEGWSKTLGADFVAEQMLKAKSDGWSREKLVKHLDDLAHGKTRDNYAQQTKVSVPIIQAEDQNWIVVKAKYLKEKPEARSWLGETVRSVYVNDTAVKIRATSRTAVEKIQEYAPRLLELFKAQKPGIEIVEVGL